MAQQQRQEFKPWCVYTSCSCVHLFLIIWLTVKISFVCTNEPLQGHVFNEKILCNTPIHILICNNISFKKESSFCVHTCLFSYQFQFGAIIYGNKNLLIVFQPRPKIKCRVFPQHSNEQKYESLVDHMRGIICSC